MEFNNKWIIWQCLARGLFQQKDLCPFPFDKALYMTPFPHGYIIPNFPKYNGKCNPIEYIREFSTMCIDIAYDPTYLMRLFPWSLIGITLEWFSQLPYGIRSWGELSEKLIEHFSFNIDNKITITSLCHTTQDEGENFITFFKRWSLASRCPTKIPEKKKVTIFLEKINSKLRSDLRVHYCTSFVELVEKGIILEKDLIEKGEIKMSNRNPNVQNIPNDRNKFWSWNKNVTNYGSVDAKTLQVGPIITLRVHNPSNNIINSVNQTANAIQNTQQPRPQRRFLMKHKFTPLMESIESVFKQLLHHNLIQLQEPRQYDPG